jgi:hypothetical protein
LILRFFFVRIIAAKKAAPRNFHLAGRRRLPFIGAIVAQIEPAHNTLQALSPLLWKILHERPGTSGQFFRTAAGFNIAQKQNLFFVRSANRQIVLLPV